MWVGVYTNKGFTERDSLNLQAWRIPLWEIAAESKKRLTFLLSQPPSLENPFVGEHRTDKELRAALTSQPPSLENPFVG